MGGSKKQSGGGWEGQINRVSGGGGGSKKQSKWGWMGQRNRVSGGGWGGGSKNIFVVTKDSRQK